MAEIIEMPKLSDTMTTGTLIKWLKKEGESVASGDMIAEVETDKATMEVECFEDGVLLKHYIAEGDSLEVGGPICAIGEEGEDAPEVEVKTVAEPVVSGPEVESEEEDELPEESEEPAPSKQSSPEPEPAESHAGKVATSGGGRVKASPLARKIAEEKDVDLTRVSGTGPGGRIVRADVEEAAKNPPAAAPAAASGPAISLGSLQEKVDKVSNMRATIARALVKSKTEAPHFYLQSEVDAAPLAKARRDLNDFLAGLPAEEGGIKYTVNDLILRAAAMAVRMVPAINRSWEGSTIKQHGVVHLAFGVAIDDGLVTPVIRNADSKSLRQIATEAKELIGKARNRKLSPNEMTGSTLTVTNLGMFGITDFYGIINPNNAAILSVGAAVKQPVVDEHDNITVGYRMKVGLSGDHRVIDGAVGAQYLQALGTLLEKPAILLV